MKKAFGFPVVRYNEGNILGVCVDEHGNHLGTWISSDLRFLRGDLKNHADGYEYEFYEVLPDMIANKIGLTRPRQDHDQKD